MELVADTNVVVAALLRPGLCRTLLLRPDLLLLSPNYLREEMVEHEHEFLEKSSLDHSSYLAAVEVILSNLHFSDQESYSIFERPARRLSPDPDDWPFFALALCQGLRDLEQRQAPQKAGESESVGH